MNITKKLYLLTPLLLFPMLYIPYSIINSRVIVKWLGCGCPRLSEDGTELLHNFNANHFTALFWNVVILVVIGVSLFLMRKLPKIWMRVVYVMFMATVSLFTAVKFFYSLQWN